MVKKGHGRNASQTDSSASQTDPSPDLCRPRVTNLVSLGLLSESFVITQNNKISSTRFSDKTLQSKKS
jgi:hypothetical protein